MKKIILDVRNYKLNEKRSPLRTNIISTTKLLR